MEKYVPNHPYIDPLELIQHQSLWFFFEDLSVNSPLPQMPNIIAVGDIMAVHCMAFVSYFNCTAL